MYPFEIAAVILLVAIVAAIRLTLRRRPENKYVDPSKQVYVRKGPDRVRVVHVDSEPRRVIPQPKAAPVEGEVEAE
jgi:NADH-quinone oxidoreductase subunit J